VGITARDPQTGLSHWRSDTARAFLDTELSIDTLAPSGTLRIALPPATFGTLHLLGTGLVISVEGRTELELSNVPAGWHGSLVLERTNSTPLVIDSGLSVPSGSIDSAGYSASSWTLRLPLPGGLVSAIRGFPLLVRLDSSWPGFASTLADGSDLRLKSAEGTALPLTIASWDKDGRKGALWTYLDSIPAPGDSIDLILDGGLPIRSDAPVPAFNASAGWSAVWPLGDTGTTVHDRLGRFPGTPTSLGTTQGIAGKASRFDGVSSKVVIQGTASGILPLPDGGPYTMSCWARLRSYTYSRFLMGYGDRGTALKYVGNTSSTNRNTWQLRDFRDAPAGVNLLQGHADTAVWTHIAATVDGDSIRLFLNGIRQAGAVSFDRSDLPRSVVDFALGTSLDSTGVGSYYFPGELSEAWIHSVVRTPDWIRFAAANQSPSTAAARLRP
ncbi:MAG: hypothetical protein RL318_1928, partial [Fibrobacterota bacterium]|jgi:hypothetical protein